MIASDFLNPEEIRRFSQRNNWAAAWVVISTWGMILGIFSVVALWTNPLTILLAIVLFGGQQLGLAVLTHDCGHGSMFTRWSVNRFVAQWLAAAFIFSDAKAYRIRHARHHRLGGTKDDPDLQNYVNYAVLRRSFLRKISRDLTGRTGIKIFMASAKGYGPRAMLTWAIAHGAMFGVLYLSGHGMLYLLWPAAWLTTHMLFIRLRNAAEHAAVPDLFDPDPRKHTRTTYARWWEKLTVAPNHVNFHLEHHILANIPCYRLEEFHYYMKDRGRLEGADLCDGYWAVIGQLVLPASSDTDPSPVT